MPPRRARSPVPRLWLMTDERAGEALWPALNALPRGSGVVFRHHATPAPVRRLLFDRVRAAARRRGLLLLLAGPPGLAAAWRADGWHGGGVGGRGLHGMSAHGRRELTAAARAAADVVFLSPVFPTRSHPGAATLGRVRFGLAARGAPVPVVALGGMTKRSTRGMAALGAHGWAAIDGLVRRIESPERIGPVVSK